MKNFSSPAVIGFLLNFCLCLIISGPLRADAIIYQHNFENLGSPPTEAQLSMPDFISQGLTSSLAGNPGSFITSSWERGKVLSLRGNVQPSLVLKLKIPNCKKLDITGISLSIYTPGSNTNFRTTTRINIAGPNGIFYNPPVGWAMLNITQVVSNLTGEVTIQISQNSFNGKELHVDDLTVYGTVTDNLVDLRTINSNGPSTRCQKWETVDFSIYNKGQYRSVQYSLDASSLAAGNQINSATGLVTFVPTFAGESTISLAATSCINLPLSGAKIVTTAPGGLPPSEMEFKTRFPDRGGWQPL